MGRPKSKNPKDILFKLRLDRDTLQKLNYCSESTTMSRSEIIRTGISKIYDYLINSEERRDSNVMVKKDNYYYWTHPKEYKRLTIDDLQNEASLHLCEFVLAGLREEMDNSIDHVNRYPKDKDGLHHLMELKHDLETPFIDALTFGHGDELVNELICRCPKGVFDKDEGSRGNEKMAGRQSTNSKANVNPLRYQRVVTGSN